jgi:cell division protein FtsL
MTKKKFSFVVVFFIAGIALAVFISVSAVREAYRSQTIEKEVETLKQEAQRVSAENSAMAERIAYFETPEFQEKIAKEKLNLQKPDEIVVVVKPGVDKQIQAVEVLDDTAIVEEIPNHVKWWNFFFKY